MQYNSLYKRKREKSPNLIIWILNVHISYYFKDMIQLNIKAEKFYSYIC